MLSNIKIRSFTGASIKPYLPSIAKLRMEILLEYPYLYDGNTEVEMRYLRKLVQCKESIAVVIFDGPKIVGAATGLPLEEETPEMKKPFIETDQNLNDYFYFGQALLLEPYRGRGIGHHFFDLREEHAKHLKRFKRACFFCVLRAEDHHLKPDDHIPLDSFWKKRGYVFHPNLKCHLKWQDLDEEEESPKTVAYWIKELS